MARYRAVWLELAAATRDTLPAPARAQLEARLEQLLENPQAPDRGGYDRAATPSPPPTATA